MHDVCVIGAVTRDIIRIKGSPRKDLPGGVVYYAGSAYHSLGLRTAVLTKAAREDADELLYGVRRLGIATHCRTSAATMVFENRYPTSNPTYREQSVGSVADAFTAADLDQVQARVAHLGPLTNRDMDPDFIAAVARRVRRVVMDVQGFLRDVDGGTVRQTDWPRKREGLAWVDALKADLSEGRLLTGEQEPERVARCIAAWGPREVALTFGDKGSLLLVDGRVHHIPAYRPRQLVDATGCGDSYFAGYNFQRFHSDDAAVCGRVGAALATHKLERAGPFSGSVAEVRERLEEHEFRPDALPPVGAAGYWEGID